MLKIGDVRLKTQRELAYFGRAVMAMKPIEKKGEGTFSVDARWRMYYDPDFLDTLELREAVTVVVHELFHLLGEHHKRFRRKVGRDKVSQEEATRWNVAADCAINGTLREFRLPFPKGIECCFPEKWNMPANLTPEEYYDLLPENPLNQQKITVMIGGGSCADGQQKPWEEPIDGNGEGEDGEGGEGEGKGKGGEGQGNGTSNGGLSDLERELLRRAVLHDIAKHAKSKGRGTIPLSLQRMVEDLLAPPARDWKKEFRCRFQREVNYVLGQGDFSFRRPRRRQLPGGIILPGMIRPVVNVAACLDTSGSMGVDDIRTGLSELSGIARALAVPFWVFCGDADVAFSRKVTSARDVRPYGGGGTDMRVLIEAAQKSKPRPDVIVVLTDGETPWPDRQTPQRVIVLLTRHGSESSVPKWMSVIKVA